jgi:hypothetical protein
MTATHKPNSYLRWGKIAYFPLEVLACIPVAYWAAVYTNLFFNSVFGSNTEGEPDLIKYVIAFMSVFVLFPVYFGLALLAGLVAFFWLQRSPKFFALVIVIYGILTAYLLITVF